MKYTLMIALGFLFSWSASAGVNELTSEQQKVLKEAATKNLYSNSAPLPANFLKAKAQVIVLWASWCEYCEAEMKELRQLQKAYGKDLQVIAVNVDTKKELGQPTVDSANKEIIFVFDDGMKLKKSFDAQKLPWQIVVDSDGMIKRTYTGYMKERFNYMAMKIARLIRGENDDN